MKRFKIILILCLFGLSTAMAQTPYIDVLTAPALALYGNSLSKKQKEQLDQMNKLQERQGWVATQMTVANQIQEKVYKGLKEVSGTLSNGLQVKSIYSNLERTVTYLDQLKDTAKDNPEYVIFANRAISQVVNHSTEIYANIADLLTSSETNLATAGDRRRLLYEIEQDVRAMNVYVLSVKMSIDRAKRKGFWRSINPFQEYVNTDAQIFEDIVNKGGRL